MQILTFLLAIVMTGLSCIYNLGNGFVGPANFTSLLMSCLVILAWCLWVFTAIVRSGNIKRTASAILIVLLVCLIGVVLFFRWEVLAKGVSLLGGLGLASGLFLGLPFAGFGKILGKLAENRLLLLIPYMLFMVYTVAIVRMAAAGSFSRFRVKEKPAADVPENEIKQPKEKKVRERPIREKLAGLVNRDDEEEPDFQEEFPEREPFYDEKMWEIPFRKKPEEESIDEIRAKIKKEADELVKELEADSIQIDGLTADKEEQKQEDN